MIRMALRLTAEGHAQEHGDFRVRSKKTSKTWLTCIYLLRLLLATDILINYCDKQ